MEQDDVTAVSNKNKCNILLEQMDHLGKVYRGYLGRQSDWDRPRTKFCSWPVTILLSAKISAIHLPNMVHLIQQYFTLVVV